MDSWFISLLQIKDYGIFLFTILTALVSALLSGLLGLEREMTGQSAGLRTHVIVSVACSLIMSTSIFAIKLVVKDNSTFSDLTYDASRIAAGILGGIGFMGAGAIVKNGFNIKGLTTAGTLFFVAAVGMACGSGFVLEAAGVTLIVLILLVGLLYIEKWLDKKAPEVIITTVFSENMPSSIKNEMSNFKIFIKNYSFEIKKDKEDKNYYEISINLAYRTSKKEVEKLISYLKKLDGIKSVSIASKNKNKIEEIY